MAEETNVLGAGTIFKFIKLSASDKVVFLLCAMLIWQSWGNISQKRENVKLQENFNDVNMLLQGERNITNNLRREKDQLEYFWINREKDSSFAHAKEKYQIAQERLDLSKKFKKLIK